MPWDTFLTCQGYITQSRVMLLLQSWCEITICRYSMHGLMTEGAIKPALPLFSCSSSFRHAGCKDIISMKVQQNQCKLHEWMLLGRPTNTISLYEFSILEGASGKTNVRCKSFYRSLVLRYKPLGLLGHAITSIRTFTIYLAKIIMYSQQSSLTYCQQYLAHL